MFALRNFFAAEDTFTDAKPNAITEYNDAFNFFVCVRCTSCSPFEITRRLFTDLKDYTWFNMNRTKIQFNSHRTCKKTFFVFITYVFIYLTKQATLFLVVCTALWCNSLSFLVNLFHCAHFVLIQWTMCGNLYNM